MFLTPEDILPRDFVEGHFVTNQNESVQNGTYELTGAVVVSNERSTGICRERLDALEQVKPPFLAE